MRAEGRAAPDPVSVTLLIDTGATSSWVRPAYMSQLGLTPRSWIDVETANGIEEDQPAYDIGLVLGGFGTANAKRFETLIGAKEFPDMPFDGLLGRDILAHIQLAWNGPSASLRIQYE